MTAARGLVLISMLVAALAVAVVTALLSVFRYVVLWMLAALAWVIGFVVRLLAKPAELLIAALRNRGRPQSAHAAEVQP